jgi:hypothetical protein
MLRQLGLLKAIIWLSLSICLQANAQYREESGALEQIYESKIRAVLNTVMRPIEYSIVVAVDINNDPKRIGELEAEVDKMNLPGIPGMLLSENMNVSNKLHELRNKVSVHLTLDESVSKVKEDTAKTLVQMKLHMDDTAGDVLVVSRAALIPKVEEPKQSNPDLLPELSWRMWSLILVLSLLGIGALVLYLQQRNKKAQEKQPTVQQNESLDGAHLEASAEVDSVKDQEVKSLPDISLEDKNRIEIYDCKRTIIDLATKYPEAASRALSEEFEKGHQSEVIIACEALGWELCRQLFTGVGHRTWGRLGVLIAKNEKPERKPELVLEALNHFRKAVYSKYLELADNRSENPFLFLIRLDPEDQIKLLSKESPQNIAVICVYLDSTQKTDLINILPTDLQQAVLIQLARMKEVPYSAVKVVAEGLRQKLKFINENPSRSFDGQKFLIDLLGTLDVISEDRFVRTLAETNPVEYAALKTNYLVFEDLTYLPEDILAEAFAGLDMQIMAQSFYNTSPDLISHCMKALPEKRAKMIEKDIAYMKSVSAKDALSARRVVVKAVNSILLINDRTPGSFFTPAVVIAEGSKEAA